MKRNASGQDIVGIVVNPRDQRPYWVVRRYGNQARVLEGELGSEWIASGKYDDNEPREDDSEYTFVTHLTDCWRVHTPAGVKDQYRGQGFGTVLYTAVLALVCADTTTTCIASAAECAGGRSRAASVWWNAAEERGLTTRKAHHYSGGSEEESVDVEDLAKCGMRAGCLEFQGEVEHVSRDYVDVLYEGPDKECDVDVYQYDRQGEKLILVVYENSEMDKGVWGYNQEAIMAADLSLAPQDMITALRAVAEERGFREEFDDALMAHVWLKRFEASGGAEGLMAPPELTPNQRRLDASLARIADARRRLGWDDLTDLP